MTITSDILAKLITEEFTYEQGPCIYPGKFKPPHKGHFSVVKDLSTRHYIKDIYVVISPKEKDGVSAKQSLEVWKTYLECDPIPNVHLEISPYPTPVLYAYKFIEARPNVKPIYIAGGAESVEDQNYFQSFKKRFGNQVIEIPVQEETDRVSGTKVRTYLQAGDYELYKTTVPDAVNSKGKTQELFKLLASTIKENVNESGIDQRTFMIENFIDYCTNLFEFENKPEIELISDPSYPRTLCSFGGYDPNTSKINVYINNRNLADILRTLAHELTHHKQRELSMLDLNSGDTGSSIENEANSVAAMIMRVYGKQNPNIYE